MEPGDPAFQWVAAEAARHAIYWCPRRTHAGGGAIVHRKLDHGALDRMLAAATAAQLEIPFVGTPERKQLLTADPLRDVLSRIWLPQLIFQRPSKLRTGQALLTYRDAPRRRHERLPSFPLAAYETALHRSLGCDLERFVLGLFQLSGKSSRAESPKLSALNIAPLADRAYDDHLYLRSERGLIEPVYSAIIKSLALDPPSLHLPLLHEGDDSARSNEAVAKLLAAPNPLLDRPLVRVFRDRPDCCIAPVPWRLQEWLYESLVDRLWKIAAAPQSSGEAVPGFTSKVVSDVFEEYVGLVADLCAPAGRPWLPESELERGDGRVVDWARPCGKHVVLVDAKRCFVSFERRYRSRPDDWRTTHKEWAKGVLQAVEFWKAVQAGDVPALREHRNRSPIAVVVSHGEADFRAFNETTTNEVDAHIRAEGHEPVPWTILSIDRFERLMTAWQREDDDWLPHTLLRAAREGHRKVFDGLPNQATGPVWERVKKLLDEFVAGVREREAEGR